MVLTKVTSVDEVGEGLGAVLYMLDFTLLWDLDDLLDLSEAQGVDEEGKPSDYSGLAHDHRL